MRGYHKGRNGIPGRYTSCLPLRLDQEGKSSTGDSTPPVGVRIPIPSIDSSKWWGSLDPDYVHHSHRPSLVGRGGRPRFFWRTSSNVPRDPPTSSEVGPLKDNGPLTVDPREREERFVGSVVRPPEPTNDQRDKFGSLLTKLSPLGSSPIFSRNDISYSMP